MTLKIVGSVVLLIGCVAMVAQAGALSARERNVLAACEAGATSIGMLTKIPGLFADCIPIWGTFNDSSWAENIDGYYSCWLAIFNNSGAYDGTVGSGVCTISGEGSSGYLNGTGTYTFVGTGPASEELYWNCSVLYSGWGGGPDDQMELEAITPKLLTRDSTDTHIMIQGSGTHRWIIDGHLISEGSQHVTIEIPLAAPENAHLSISMPLDAVYLNVDVDLTAGTFTGTVGVTGPSSVKSETWSGIRALFR